MAKRHSLRYAGDGGSNPRLGKVLGLFLLFAAVLSILALPAAEAKEPQPEPVRRGFENWLAVFEPDGTAYCRPRGYLYRNRKVPDFQLRVVRGSAAAGCRIMLISAFHFVDLSREMRVRVDGNPSLRIEALTGLKSDAGATQYEVSDAVTVETMLRRMRAGAWIRFDYIDTAGQPSDAVFSLMGVSDALNAIGCGR